MSPIQRTKTNSDFSPACWDIFYNENILHDNESNSNNYMIELYTDHLLIVCQLSYRTTLLTEFFKFRRKNNLQYCLDLNLKSFNFLSTISKHIYTIEINKH